MTDFGKWVYVIYFGSIVVGILVMMWRDAGRKEDVSLTKGER